MREGTRGEVERPETGSRFEDFKVDMNKESGARGKIEAPATNNSGQVNTMPMPSPATSVMPYMAVANPMLISQDSDDKKGYFQRFFTH